MCVAVQAEAVPRFREPPLSNAGTTAFIRDRGAVHWRYPRLPVQCRYDLLCLEQPPLQSCERFVFRVVELAVKVVWWDILESAVDGS